MLKHVDVVRKAVLEEMLGRLEARIAETSDVPQGFALLRERGPIACAIDDLEFRAGGSKHRPYRLEELRRIVAMYEYGPKNSPPFDEAEKRLRVFCVKLHIWLVVRGEIRLKLGLDAEDSTQQAELNPAEILAAVRALVNTVESEHP